MLELSYIAILLSLFSYLFGSISTSIIIAKMLQLPDPRTVGSLNAGATNMLRIGGKKVAAFTLIMDMLKGLLPLLIAHFLHLSVYEMSIVGLMSIVGHIFPLFFGLRGGKGVATFIGVLVGLNLYSAVVFVSIWLFIAKILKISSLSALIATFFVPLYFYFFTQNSEGVIIISATCILIIAKHKSNIIRLLTNTEDNINAR